MRRMMARWMISRSIDCGRDAPAWVRRLAAGDEQLARYEASARQLAGALQNDAPAWRALAGGKAAHRTSTPAARGWLGWRNLAPRRVAAAVVVVGLLTGGMAWRFGGETGPTAPQIVVAQSTDEAIVRRDVDWLLAALGDSQSSFGELVTQLDPLKTPRPSRREFRPQVDAAVTFFAYRLPASTAKVAGLSHATATLESPDLLSRFWLGKRGS